MVARKLAVTPTPERIIRDPEFAKRLDSACTVSGREIDGAVNLIAGLIEMDGGHATFSDEEGVDLHAIIKGAKYDFAVVVAEDGVFRVPATTGAVVLGTVKRGFTVEIYEIPDTALNRGVNRGGVVEVKTSAKGLRRVERFAQRLG